MSYHTLAYRTNDGTMGRVGIIVGPDGSVTKVDSPPPSKPPGAVPSPCRKCGTEVYRWAGFLWIGTPMPLRIWRRLRRRAYRNDGCGCLLLPKSIWAGIVSGISRWRNLRRTAKPFR